MKRLKPGFPPKHMPLGEDRIGLKAAFSIHHPFLLESGEGGGRRFPSGRSVLRFASNSGGAFPLSRRVAPRRKRERLLLEAKEEEGGIVKSFSVDGRFMVKPACFDGMRRMRKRRGCGWISRNGRFSWGRKLRERQKLFFQH